MASEHRPFTLMGKQIKTPSTPTKKVGYRTKGYSSEVDETLFGKPNRYVQQIETKRMSNDQEWDPPWVTSPTKKGAPLLWTPFVYEGSVQPERRSSSQAWSKPRTPRSARPSSSKYRMRSHTPTYVDETLFGPKPQEPSFKAPWEENNNSNCSKHLLWSPVIRNDSPTSPRSNSSYDRPGSRLGEYDDPYIPPTPRDGTQPTNVTPVIKQRAGSSLKTLLGTSPPPTNMNLKLDFQDRNVTDKDELIERALRLAKQAQEASLKETTTPRRTAWNRPASAGSSPRNSSRARPHFNDFLPGNDALSATGIRVPFSARSDRPASARTRASSARRPLSSREATSKPSWKP